MKFVDFVAYCNKLLEIGVRGVILTGGGEPTISPDFDKISAWLERNDIPYGVNTNLVIPKYINPVFLKVSIDTGDEDEFERVRGKRCLKNVLHNVRDFAAYRKSINGRTKLGVQSVALTENDVLSFYDAVRDLDVDYIYIRPKESIEGGGVTGEEVKKWLEHIKDERINVSYKFDLSRYMPPFCVGNWASITVDWNGNVLYCCNRPDVVVGHVLDNNILQKKEMVHVDMRRCERPCRLSGVNWYIEHADIESDNMFI